MFAVVNTMTLARGLDLRLIARMQDQLMADGASVPGFLEANFIQVAADTAVMVVICETPSPCRPFMTRSAFRGSARTWARTSPRPTARSDQCWPAAA